MTMNCPTCGKPGYQAPYTSAEGFVKVLGVVTRGWRFKKAGEFRTPLRGEWYLSGSIPAAYCAPNDLTGEYHILERVP
jgi:hypothetical protein